MDKIKKITLLVSTLGGGGAEGVCVTIANCYAAQGWKVDLVILNLKNAVYHDRISNQVNLIVLDTNHARYAAPALLKYIRKENPEKIIVFNYELPILLVLLRLIFGFKTKIIARNINTISQSRKVDKKNWRKDIIQRFVNKLYCRVDHVINQCDAMEQDLLSIFPELNGKTSVIYNPVASHIETYSKKINFESIKKKNYILCVGRLEEQKAFHYAIKAFSYVLDTIPNIRLKIVGQGSLDSSLKQLAFDLNISDRVDFEGFQKDIIPYYLYARATVLTSLYEGFPNVLIESITLGTPVIAFDCPSGPSEIINKDNGLLVKHKNVENLIFNLNILLSQPISIHNVKQTSEKYEANVVFNYYEEVVKSI